MDPTCDLIDSSMPPRYIHTLPTRSHNRTHARRAHMRMRAHRHHHPTMHHNSQDAYRLDAFAGTVTLLVESQEQCFVAVRLVQEGQEVEVGTPIALLSERAEEVGPLRERAALEVARAGNAYEFVGRLRTLEWQSYLKGDNDNGGGGGGMCVSGGPCG